MTEICPCGLEKEVKTETSIRLREGVDVLSCLCGREKKVILYGPYDKVKSGHDKFTILADSLG